MHELSVCLAIIDQVRTVAAERDARSATRIEVRVGPLSGVECDLLQNAWPLACAGTLAASAELVIDEAAIVVCCESCGEESTATPNRLVCGACGDYRTVLVSGDEMILQRVELETA